MTTQPKMLSNMGWGNWSYDYNRKQEQPPLVTIFGAGVAGLTAAHELVERGFNVLIVEPTKSQMEEYCCEIGGMAANQLGRVKVDLTRFKQLNPDFVDNLPILEAERALLMQPVQKRFPLTQKIRFSKEDKPENMGWITNTDDYGVTNEKKLREIASILKTAHPEYRDNWEVQSKRLPPGLRPPDLSELQRDILQVQVLGYTDCDGLPEKNRETSKRWAEAVKKVLEDDGVPASLLAEGCGGEIPLGDQSVSANRARSNRVEFAIVEQVIPGEHGFRFFPSFYRHLFDTMKRTPVFNLHGNLTAETAYDQLVDTSDILIGLNDGERLMPVKLERFTTVQALQETVKFFKDKLRFSDRDILRLQTHLLKYLTSSKQRRGDEAEKASLWQYIRADRVHYSQGAAEFIKQTPQALVAMSAEETDARTQYNGIIQLLFDNPFEPFVADKTLNGTTSGAWLKYWKDYLKRKGVKFFNGKLLGLSLIGDDFAPEIGGPKDCTLELKTPLKGASESAVVCASEIPPETPSSGTLCIKLANKTCRYVRYVSYDSKKGIFRIPGTDFRKPNDAAARARLTTHNVFPETPEDFLPEIGELKNGILRLHTPLHSQCIEVAVNPPIPDDTPSSGTLCIQLNTNSCRYVRYTSYENITKNDIKIGTFQIGPTDFSIPNHAVKGAPVAVFPEKVQEYLIERFKKSDFFVMAMPYEQASQAIWDAYSQIAESSYKSGFTGPFEQLKQFNDYVGQRPDRSGAIRRVRDPITGRPQNPKDPLRDISGIQYFMPQNYRFGDGHVYYPDSPWALSSISQVAFWRERVSPIGIYLGQISFDVGNWYQADKRGKTAWNSTRQEIADEVWKQGCEALDSLYASHLFKPLYYHIDYGIVFKQGEEPGTVERNLNPYIINVPGQWHYRPGILLQGRGEHARQTGIWYASGAESLFRRWVPAGTYMATYTRLTTMESANESARHAVNAILHKLLEKHSPPIFNGVDEEGALLGDLCEIWDPEDCEPPGLNTFRELDEALMREGLPHILDIFAVFDLVESLPDDISMTEGLERLRAVMEAQYRSVPLSLLAGLDALEGITRTNIDLVRALFGFSR